MENGFKKEECKYADKTLRQLSVCGDTLDMCASGYFQNEGGSLYGEGMHDYLSLEYYHGSLDGSKRILMALSMYMRGELDVVALMNIYNIILQQENVEKT